MDVDVVVFGHYGPLEVGLFDGMKAWWDKELGPWNSVVGLLESHTYNLLEEDDPIKEFLSDLRAIFDQAEKAV
jgi:hypothetical protein